MHNQLLASIMTTSKMGISIRKRVKGLNIMSVKKKIVIVAASLFVSGAACLLLDMIMAGLFLLITGIIYLLLCTIIFFAQKFVLRCPACGFEVMAARKEFNRTGMSKCPKCGTLIFTHLNK